MWLEAVETLVGTLAGWMKTTFVGRWRSLERRHTKLLVRTSFEGLWSCSRIAWADMWSRREKILLSRIRGTPGSWIILGSGFWGDVPKFPKPYPKNYFSAQTNSMARILCGSSVGTNLSGRIFCSGFVMKAWIPTDSCWSKEASLTSLVSICLDNFVLDAFA